MIRYEERYLKGTDSGWLIKIFARSGLIYRALLLRRVVIDYDPCGRNEYGWRTWKEWQADT